MYTYSTVSDNKEPLNLTGLLENPCRPLELLQGSGVA